MQWTKKYQPSSTTEIQGQNKAIEQLTHFLNNYKTYNKKAVLIYGSPGCGKTSTVYALAKQFNKEIIEINASDFRNKDKIATTVGTASQQMSLFMKEKLILIDEVDGLSGNKDRGGISEIIKVIKQTKFPIILTANDIWHKKFSGLRSTTESIKFNTLKYTSINALLKKIAIAENIQIDDNLLKSLAIRSGGDLRGAITDLQTLSFKPEITKEDIEYIGGRKQTDSIFNALLRILKTTNMQMSLESLNNVDENLDEIMLWLDENLAKEYTIPEDLYDAYDKLSKANVFKGRIMRWQHWRYLVYINFLITAGISLSKKEKYKTYIQYTRSTRPLEIWKAKQSNIKKYAIAHKIAEKTHTSTKRVLKDFNFYKNIINKAQINELELNKEEVTYLKR